MSGIERLFFVLVFIGIFSCISLAQVVPDSLNVAPVDTIIIYNEPVIIRESIYIPPRKVAFKEKKIFLEVAVSPFYNITKYSSCDCYGNYLDLYKKATTNRFSYALQGSITYLSKHLYTNLGIGYLKYRASFQHNIVDSTDARISHNSFDYFNIFLNGGYRIRLNKFSFIPTAGIYFNNLISIKGNSLQALPDSSFTTVDIKQVTFLRQNLFSGSVSIKILFQLFTRLHITSEPFYLFELSSATKKPTLYYEQKNSIGLRVGVLYGF